jgi:hypothetical protein
MSDTDGRVVVRVWRDKCADAIALLVDIRAGAGLVQSYMHIGQHGGADYAMVVARTRPATEEEAAPLLEELERIGYVGLRQIRRWDGRRCAV